MKTVTLTLAGCGGAMLLALSMFGAASAQTDMPAAAPDAHTVHTAAEPVLSDTSLRTLISNVTKAATR